MSRQQKPSIVLDWINVSYRSVGLVVVGLVVAVAGVALLWFQFAGAGPRSEAAAAIAQAEERFDEATALEGDERLDELRANARVALQEARTNVGDGRFDDARRAAIRSENLSRKAVELAKGEKDSRKVSFYRLEGDVRVKRAGEFSWEAADTKMALGIGDQIKTAASASAQIIYFDGTVTTIQSGSLLEIRELSEDPGTRVRKVSEKLNWGSVVASTQKKNPDGSMHEVATDRVSARVTEPGEVRVAYDKEKRTSFFDVFSGKAVIDSGSKRESLEAGERIGATAEGALLAKQALPAAPRLIGPTDQRVFVFDAPEKEVTTFSWEKVPQAVRYHLVISDRQLFTEPLLDDAERRDNSVMISAIAPADYFWRVSAINGAGAEGPWSAVRRFRVTTQRVRDRGDTKPPILEVSDFVQTGAMVILNGKTEPGALLWVDNEKIEVSDNGTFYAVVRLRKEGNNTITLLAQDAAGNTQTLRKTAVLEGF